MTITPHSSCEPSGNSPHDTQLKIGLNVFSGTRCGWYHKKNEDYLLYDLNNGFFGLSDGVGGGQLGDVASETLLKFLHNQHQVLPTDKQIIHDLQTSDIYVQNVLANYNARGAATVVLAWLDENAKGFISSVGDARIYLLDIVEDSDVSHSKICLTQLTIDQTYENLGVPVPKDRHPDDPIRMIGIGAVGEPPVQEVQLRHNQALFLCSDGVHKFLTTEQMEDICKNYLINRPNDLPLQSIANTLIKEAVNNESHDDCSVLIVLNYRPEDIQPITDNIDDDLDPEKVLDATNENTFDDVQDATKEQTEVSQMDSATSAGDQKEVKIPDDQSNFGTTPPDLISSANEKMNGRPPLFSIIACVVVLFVLATYLLFRAKIQ